MALKEERKIMVGGINTDADNNLLPVNSVRDLVNLYIQNNAEGSIGLAKSLPSTEAITFTGLETLPAGSYCVGMTEDISNSCVYYAIFNNAANHGIYRIVFSDTSGAYLEEILTNSVLLNFKLDHPVSMYVIDGWLYFTDGWDEYTEDVGFFVDVLFNPNQPKKIDIERAKEYNTKEYKDSQILLFDPTKNYIEGKYCLYWDTAAPTENNAGIWKVRSGLPGYPITGAWDWNEWEHVEKFNIEDSYLFLGTNELLRVPTPPQYPPTFEYIDSDDADAGDVVTPSNIQEKEFQFRYRYLYQGGMYSTTSPISKVTFQNDDEISFYQKVSNNINYAIKVALNSGNSEAIKIEVLARIGNVGDWNVIETINKYDPDGYMYIENGCPNEDIEVVFKNHGIPYLIEQVEANRLFSNVPQVSKMNLLVGNRNVDVDYVEDYDFLEWDYAAWDTGGQSHVEPYYKELSETLLSDTWLFETPPTTPAGTAHIHFTPDQASYPANTAFYLVAPQHVGGTLYSFRYITTATTTRAVIRQYFIGQLNAISVATAWSGGIGTNLIIVDSMAWNLDLPGASGITSSILHKYKTIPFGTEQKFGVAYYDEANRTTSISTNDNFRLIVPPLHQQEDPDILYNNWQVLLKYELFHTPPQWASAYSIVWLGSNILWKQQYVINVADMVDGADYTYAIKINRMLGLTKELYGSCKIPDYDFVAGDYLRIVGVASVADSDPKFTVFTGTNFEDTNNVILGGATVGADYEIYVQKTPHLDSLKEGYAGYLFLVEVYRPASTLDPDAVTVGYEISETYPIKQSYQPERVHGAGWDDGSGYARDQNITTSESARGIIELAGTWVYRNRLTWSKPTQRDFYIESWNASALYQSDNKDMGRIVVFDNKRKRTRYPERLIYSGTFQQDGIRNDLGTVDTDTYIQLDKRHGAINGASYNGNVLSIKQNSLITSLYINQGLVQTLNSTQFGNMLTVTDSFIGGEYKHTYKAGMRQINASCFDMYGNEYIYDWDNNAIFKLTQGGIQDLTVWQGGGIKRLMQQIKSDMSTLLQTANSSAHVKAAFDAKTKNVYFQFVVVIEYIIPATNRDINYYLNAYVNTLGYNTDSGQWFRRELDNETNFPAENIYSFADNIIYFFQGTPYLNNSGTLFNNIFGENKIPSVSLLFNAEPFRNKVWKSIEITGNELLAWEAPDYGDVSVPATINYPNGMRSKLPLGRFEVINGNIFYTFMRNSVTNDVVDSLSDLINGCELEGKFLSVKLSADQDEDEMIINSVAVKYNPK